MNPYEKELKQIEQIRKLRVNNFRRKQSLVAAERSQAVEQIQLAEQSYQTTEIELVQEQRTQLQTLKSAGSVKPHEVVAYTKLQLKGVKQIKDAFSEIENSKSKLKEVQQRLNSSTVELNKAEKKLIGLQEVIKEEFWNE